MRGRAVCMLTAVDDARTRVTLELYTPRPLPKRAKGSNPTRGDAPSFLFFVPLASYSFTDQPRFSRSLISRRCTLPRLRIWLWLLLARSVASLHGLAFVRTCSAAPSLCLFRSPVPLSISRRHFTPPQNPRDHRPTATASRPIGCLSCPSRVSLPPHPARSTCTEA